MWNWFFNQQCQYATNVLICTISKYLTVLDQKQRNIFGRISLFWSVELQAPSSWMEVTTIGWFRHRWAQFSEICWVSKENKVTLYYTNDKRTCLHTINTSCHAAAAQKVPARRPGMTAGFSQARRCHATALSGCDQPQEAYNPVGIHQMAPPSTRPVNKPTTHLSTPEGWKTELA